MGQAAFLSRNLSDVSMSFYASVPGKLLKDVKESSKGLITVLYFFQAFISLRIIIIIRLKECSFLLRSSTNLACTCGCSSCCHCCQSTCYLVHILNCQAMSCNTMFPTCQGCYKQTDPWSVIHPWDKLESFDSQPGHHSWFSRHKLYRTCLWYVILL